MGVEVEGEGVRRLDGAGLGGRGSVGSRVGPAYLQSSNKHTRSNQCKMIMGNIIVCPAGPKIVCPAGPKY